MKIVFRADASFHIGTGHIARCVTLAKELRRRGAEVSFVSRTHPGHLIALLDQEGFTTAPLPGAGVPPPQSEDYAAWRGVSEEQDAAETLAAADGCDWLVSDHYGLGTAWERGVRAGAARIAAIDDLGRTHDADLVIDQNLSEDPSRYAGAARRLLGPAFALLADEYRTGPRARVRDDVARLFMFFGGGDPRGTVVAAAEALSGAAFSGMHLDIAVGAASPHRATLEAWAGHRGRAAVHAGLPSLAGLMATADLAVGGGGIAMLERCCLGLPQIVLTVAANQIPGTRALAVQNAIVHLGDFTSGLGRLADAVTALAADAGRRRALSEQGRLLVDGWGTARVAEQIAPTPTAALALRPAEDGDCRFYHALVNDPEVRRNSFQSAPIPWDQHQVWFARRLASADSQLWVLTASGLPVGQVRLDRHGGRAHIDYSLDPLVRGRGWGLAIIALGLAAFFREHDMPVRAEVKSGNLASRAIFEKLGFRTVQAEQNDMIAFEMDRTMSAAGRTIPGAGRTISGAGRTISGAGRDA